MSDYLNPKHDIPSCSVSESALVCGIVCINKFGLMGIEPDLPEGWRSSGLQYLLENKYIKRYIHLEEKYSNRGCYWVWSYEYLNQCI